MIRVSLQPAPHAAARSALATVEITAGVALAHSLAGGALPSVPWLLGAAGLVFIASERVIRHRARILWSLPALFAAQLLLHGFLTTTATGGAHDHGPGAPLHLTWQMLAAHSAAAVLTAFVWRVRRRLLAVIWGWPVAAVVLPRLSTIARYDAVASPWLTLWHLGAPRRGPPAGCCHL